MTQMIMIGEGEGSAAWLLWWTEGAAAHADRATELQSYGATAGKWFLLAGSLSPQQPHLIPCRHHSPSRLTLRTPHPQKSAYDKEEALASLWRCEHVTKEKSSGNQPSKTYHPRSSPAARWLQSLLDVQSQPPATPHPFHAGTSTPSPRLFGTLGLAA